MKKDLVATKKSKSRIAALILMIITIILALFILPLSLFNFVIAFFFNDSGTRISTIFSFTILPAILILGCVIISIILYRKKRYWSSIVLSVIAISPFVCLALFAGYRGVSRYMTMNSELNAPADSPELVRGLDKIDQLKKASGFLMPTDKSVPSDFRETTRQINKDSYVVAYSPAQSDRYASWTEIRFIEYNYGLSFSSFLDRTHRSEQRESYAKMNKLIHFTYANQSGNLIIISSANDPDFASYELYWNDNGNDLIINVRAVPTKLFSPTDVIDLLGTLERRKQVN
jgi:hypothetical protein